MNVLGITKPLDGPLSSFGHFRQGDREIGLRMITIGIPQVMIFGASTSDDKVMVISEC